MQHEHSAFQKVRFCTNIGVLYLLTMSFAWWAMHTPPPFKLVAATTVQKSQTSQAPAIPLIAGIPDRIVIPGSSYDGTVVDLPIDPGYYDSATGTWTLSGLRAQYITFSSLANNTAGETYIYGHNNDYVFGALRHVTPVVGSTALIYTTNNHIFSYTFVSATSVAPSVTSVLSYKGPPIMIIQTCTGSFNEVRTLYRYNFQKVVQ
jgi:hypothetical protein